MTEDITPTTHRTFYELPMPYFASTSDRILMRKYHDALIEYKNDESEMKRNIQRHEAISAELIRVKDWMTKHNA